MLLPRAYYILLRAVVDTDTHTYTQLHIILLLIRYYIISTGSSGKMRKFETTLTGMKKMYLHYVIIENRIYIRYIPLRVQRLKVNIRSWSLYIREIES